MESHERRERHEGYEPNVERGYLLQGEEEQELDEQGWPRLAQQQWVQGDGVTRRRISSPGGGQSSRGQALIPSRALESVSNALICRACGQQGDPGVWCECCARLTHQGCAMEVVQENDERTVHLVCATCAYELEQESGQTLEACHEQVAQRAVERQAKAEEYARSLAEAVNQAGALLGTAAGATAGAAIGGQWLSPVAW